MMQTFSIGTIAMSANGGGHVNEALDVDDERYRSPQIAADPEAAAATEIRANGDTPKQDVVAPKVDEDGFQALPYEPNGIMDKVEKARQFVFDFLSDHRTAAKVVLRVVLFLLFHAYLIGAIVHHHNSGTEDLEWCDGLGFLIIITVIVYLGQIYGRILRPLHR